MENNKIEIDWKWEKVNKTLITIATELSGHPDFYVMTKEEEQLHSDKNRDYAQGGDPLGNFKRVGSILSLYPELDHTLPETVALVYMLKQLDAALWMLSQKYEGQVETIDARLRDVSVYAKLIRILHKEQADGRG